MSAARGRRLLVGASVVALLVGAVSAPGAAAGSRAEGGEPRPAPQPFAHEDTGCVKSMSLNTLHIEVEVPKRRYRLGETIRLPVEVSRPAQEDPLGLGIPMDRSLARPAAGVSVGVGLTINDFFLYGFSTTDDDGRATIDIRIERRVRPGTASARFLAWNTLASTPCFRVQEWGFKREPAVFRVVP